MKHNSNELWQSFKTSFVSKLKEASGTTLLDAWDTQTIRTSYYFDNLLPSVAADLGYTFEKEFLVRVDGAMCKLGSEAKTKVPIVFIECENDVKSSDREIIKLCGLNAPLKVLIICSPWHENKKIEVREGYWEYLIHDYAEVSSLSGYLAVIIGEYQPLHNSINFYTYVYDELGVAIDSEDQLIFEQAYD